MFIISFCLFIFAALILLSLVFMNEITNFKNKILLKIKNRKKEYERRKYNKEVNSIHNQEIKFYKIRCEFCGINEILTEEELIKFKSKLSMESNLPRSVHYDDKEINICHKCANKIIYEMSKLNKRIHTEDYVLSEKTSLILNSKNETKDDEK